VPHHGIRPRHFLRTPEKQQSIEIKRKTRNTRKKSVNPHEDRFIICIGNDTVVGPSLVLNANFANENGFNELSI